MTTQDSPKNLAGILILAGGLSTRMGSPKALLTLPSGETLLDYHVRKANKLNVPILIADNGQGFQPNNTSTARSMTNRNQVNHVLDYLPQSSNVDAQSKHSAGPLGAILAGMQHLLASSTKTDSGLTNSTYLESSNLNSLHLDSPEVSADSRWVIVVSCDSLVNGLDIWQYVTAKDGQLLNGRPLLSTVTHEHSTDDRDSSSVTNSNSLEQNKVLPHKVLPQIYCLADDERDYPLLALYQLNLAQQLQTYLDSGERRVMGFIKPISHSVSMPQAWYSLSNLNTPDQFRAACVHLFG